MQVTFLRSVTYPDGSKRLYLKNGSVSRNKELSNYRRELTRRINIEQNLFKRKKLIDEFNILNTLITNPKIERKKHLIDLKLNETNLDNRRRAAQRLKNELFQICECNDFKYFVTLTFNDDKINSYDDLATRKAFSNFCYYLRVKFPKLYYVCVPEYQNRGVLHFHLLIGGVSMQELGAAPAINPHNGEFIYKRGKQIFNITAWKKGFSSMSIIENLEASRHYITKYITKQHADQRLFGKKRYYVSRNIIRPVVERATILRDNVNLWDIDLSRYDINYFSLQKQYGVFETKKRAIKRGELYGFFCNLQYSSRRFPFDFKKLKISLWSSGISTTIRKSQLVRLAIPKKTKCYRNAFNDFTEQFAFLDREYERQRKERIQREYDEIFDDSCFPRWFF